jgi:capsid protein
MAVQLGWLTVKTSLEMAVVKPKFDGGGWKIKKVHNHERRNSKSASVSNYSGFGSIRQFAVSFNGERNLGEAGPIKTFLLDYDALRARSWQAYLESDVAQFVLNKFLTWTIGKGLKLQSEPVKRVLENEKITVDANSFSDTVESYFSLFCESKKSTHSQQRNLHHLEARVFLNSIIGGDVLCILRYVNDRITVQAVDGKNIVNPIAGSSFFGVAKDNGNIIFNGIEFSPEGQHVAFYVRLLKTNDLFGYEVERIPAKSSDGELTMAFLVVGLEYRLDSKRGLPLLSAVFEKLKQLERYQSATIGSAEERAKIPYFIKHTTGSTGENPLLPQMAKILNADAVTDDVPIDDAGNKLADKVAATNNKTVYNMPVNSEMQALEAKNELYFKDFFSTNIDLVCASVEIPPNVAMSKYDTSFSSSRAALKDWEHTLHVKRYNFSCQFWDPIYAFFLEVNILKNRIIAPGYIKARITGNDYILDAYRTARFVGANVPHIDPLKEVMAEREKLGDTGSSIPLTTAEAATEALNGGESGANMEQFALELQKSKDLGIVLPIAPVVDVAPPGEKKTKKKAIAAMQASLFD